MVTSPVGEWGRQTSRDPCDGDINVDKISVSLVEKTRARVRAEETTDLGQVPGTW